MPRFFSRRGGRVEARVPPPFLEVLSSVPALLDAVGEDPDDPAARRLRPPFFLDDPAADTELRRLAESDLDAGRRRDRDLVRSLAAGGGRGRLDREDAEAVLRVLAEARLVLAARAGVEGEEDYEEIDPRMAGLLDVLGVLQVELLEALAVEGGAP